MCLGKILDVNQRLCDQNVTQGSKIVMMAKKMQETKIESIFDGLNKVSVHTLQTLGISDERIVKSLNYVMSSK